MSETTNQAVKKDMNLNPTGKGGFGDNPQNQSPGGWKKENVFSYQYKRFMGMSTNEFKAFADVIKAGTCTMVERAAWFRVKDMHDSLSDVKEITDRTEGKAPQNIDMTSNGETIAPLLVTFVSDDD